MMSTNIFNNFLKKYKPDGRLNKPSESTLAVYESKVPSSLVAFWREYGFGSYGEGALKVIDPAEYAESYTLWTQANKNGGVPMLLTAFGDIFWYERWKGDGDAVGILDINRQSMYECTFDFDHFFQSVIVNFPHNDYAFRGTLFKQAKSQLGKLQYEEIYYFKIPSFIAGGTETLSNLEKGNAVEQQIFLYHYWQRISKI